MKPILSLLLISVYQLSWAQSISGKVVDAQTQEPLVYAHVKDLNLGTGTVTNENGHFKLGQHDSLNRVEFSYIGYQSVIVDSIRNQCVVELIPKTNVLNTISVYSDYDFLYDWLQEIRDNKKSSKYSSKCYYQLKSYIDGGQQEFIEAYYNGEFTGAQLADLDLKNGRFSINETGQRFYFSSETSKSFQQLNIYGKNQYFPETPLALKRKQLKKVYNLSLVETFLVEKDTVAVVAFEPKEHADGFFSGKLWYNKNQQKLVKISLNSLHTRHHPFLSFWDEDTITGVDLQITQSFLDQGEVDQIQFQYDVHFKQMNGRKYKSQTECFIKAYDHNDPFKLPIFEFSNTLYRDYHHISSLPQNSFFWNHYKGFYSNVESKEERNFKYNMALLSEANAYQKSFFFSSGMLEHRYVHWSEERIILRTKKDLSDYTELPPSSRYSFKIQWFFDMDVTPDSNHYVVANIIDPSESYFHYDLTPQHMAFINIYFDIYEVYLQQLQDILLKEQPNREEAEKYYYLYLEKANNKAKSYTKEVARGDNKAMIEKWNNWIIKELEIDNIALSIAYFK